MEKISFVETTRRNSGCPKVRGANFVIYQKKNGKIKSQDKKFMQSLSGLQRENRLEKFFIMGQIRF